LRQLAIRLFFAYTPLYGCAGSVSTQAAEKKYFVLPFPEKLPRIHKCPADTITLASRVLFSERVTFLGHY